MYLSTHISFRIASFELFYKRRREIESYVKHSYYSFFIIDCRCLLTHSVCQVSNLQHTASKQVKTFSFFFFRLYKILVLAPREKKLLVCVMLDMTVMKMSLRAAYNIQVLPPRIFFRFTYTRYSWFAFLKISTKRVFNSHIIGTYLESSVYLNQRMWIP